MSREPSNSPEFSELVDQLDAGENNRIAIDNASEDPDSSADNSLTSSESAMDLQPAMDSEADEDRPTIQPSEVSADDLDISEWKAPTTREAAEATDNNKDSDGAAGGGSASTSPESLQPQAQSDLRRVIDDFAEEHQQQLDADRNGLTNSTNTHDLSTAGRAERTADGTVSRKAPDEIGSHIEHRPVTTEDDDARRRSTQSYGLRGTLFPEEDTNPESHEDPDISDNVKNSNVKNSYGSGEP